MQFGTGLLSPGAGETNLVAGEVKYSPGRIWSISGCRGMEKLLGETQKCHLVGFHLVCYRGVYKTYVNKVPRTA